MKKPDITEIAKQARTEIGKRIEGEGANAVFTKTRSKTITPAHVARLASIEERDGLPYQVPAGLDGVDVKVAMIWEAVRDPDDLLRTDALQKPEAAHLRALLERFVV